MRETIQTLSNDLARSPLALGLILMNLVFVAAGLYLLRDISKAVERKDAMLAQMISEHCMGVRDKN